MPRRSGPLSAAPSAEAGIPALVIPVRSVVRAAIVVTFVLVYPLRHLSYAPAWLIAESPLGGERGSWTVPAAEAIFIGLLGPAVVWRLRFPRRLSWLPLWALLLAGLFGASTLATAAGEGSRPDWRTILAAARFHLRWVAPFFVGLTALGRADARWLLRLIFGLALANVPLSLVQYFAVRGRDFAGDYVTGFMGLFGSGSLMILQVLAIAGCVVMYRAGQLAFSRLLVLSSVLVVPIALGDSLFGFLLLPFAILIAMGWWRVVFSKRTLRILAAGIVLLALAAGIYSRAFRLPFTTRFTLDFLEQVTVGEFHLAVTGEVRPGRLRILRMVNDAVTARPHTVLFGVGPGSGSLSTFAGSGSFATRHRSYIEAVVMLAGMVLLELGYLGTLWWVALLLAIVWTLRSGTRRLGDGDPEAAWMLRVVRLVVVVLAPCALYNFSYLAPELMYPIWLLVGWAMAHVSVHGVDTWREAACAS